MCNRTTLFVASETIESLVWSLPVPIFYLLQELKSLHMGLLTTRATSPKEHNLTERPCRRGFSRYKLWLTTIFFLWLTSLKVSHYIARCYLSVLTQSQLVFQLAAWTQKMGSFQRKSFANSVAVASIIARLKVKVFLGF